MSYRQIVTMELTVRQTLKLFVYILSGAIFCSTIGYSQESRLDVGAFSTGSLDGWEDKSFSGLTVYEFVQDGSDTVLSAKSNGTASGMGLRVKIDLEKTPYLNWRWRVDQRLQGLDEQSKAGDDYAARVYVIKSGGALLWRTKVMNYVWSGSQARDASWNNAFKPKNAKMLAVQGSDSDEGVWVNEKRNIKEDFATYFGVDLDSIDGVAIMTDTDNSGGTAAASYGDIYFTAQ